MELPADPRKLYLDMFDQYGRSLEEETEKRNRGGWQLSSNEPETRTFDDQGTAFGIEKGDYYD
jgi:hypothetical protein